MSLISLAGVSKVYGGRTTEQVALRTLDLTINEGEFVAITGPSGSGKSTLLNIIGLLDRPSLGTYRLTGTATESRSDTALATIRNEDIGFVFQSFNLLPRMTVLQNVLLPTVYARRRVQPDKAVQLLDQVGLHDKLQAYPNQLSGGQQQRVAIARALVMDPKLILADEPTGNLDTKTSREIMELLTSVHASGNTIIMITHEPDIAAYASRRISMRDGRIERDERASKGVA